MQIICNERLVKFEFNCEYNLTLCALVDLIEFIKWFKNRKFNAHI